MRVMDQRRFRMMRPTTMNDAPTCPRLTDGGQAGDDHAGERLLADRCQQFAGRLQPLLGRFRRFGRCAMIEQGLPARACRIIELAKFNQQRVRPGFARVQVELSAGCLAIFQQGFNAFTNLAFFGIVRMGVVMSTQRLEALTNRLRHAVRLDVCFESADNSGRRHLSPIAIGTQCLQQTLDRRSVEG